MRTQNLQNYKVASRQKPDTNRTNFTNEESYIRVICVIRVENLSTESLCPYFSQIITLFKQQNKPGRFYSAYALQTCQAYVCFTHTFV